MPSSSKKQHNFMAAIAKNPAFAKKVGIKQSVGEEFLKADKGRKFREGGMAKEMHSEKSEMKQDVAQDKKMIKKAFRMHDAQEHKGGKGTNLSKLRKGGMAMKKVKRYDGEEESFVTETKQGQNKNIDDDVRARAMKAIAEGGQKEEAPKAKPRARAKSKSNVMTSSMSRMNPMGDTYKSGGKVRGCGIAQRGLTKGKHI